MPLKSFYQTSQGVIPTAGNIALPLTRPPTILSGGTLSPGGRGFCWPGYFDRPDSFLLYPFASAPVIAFSPRAMGIKLRTSNSSPGAGKSMLAKRIPTILPVMSLEESLETTRIHSSVGLLAKGDALIATCPVRSPHHTISDVAVSQWGAR